MNLLGRLFIVLIFIGSIMLMSWSVALNVTHKNWREHATKLDQDLKKKTQDLAELQRQKDALESAFTLEINSQARLNVALKEKIDQLMQENEIARENLDKLQTQLTEQTAVVGRVSEETQQLRNRLEKANEDLLAAQYDWVDMSTKLVRKMDEAHSLAIQVATYQTYSAQLAKDYRDAVEILRRNGWSGDPALYASQPPSGIRGMVTEVRPGGVIEISIGMDSGIVKGHHLDIVRHREGRSSYIGRVEITNVAADRAVAKVMPEFRRGVVQRDDEVTYIDINELVAH